jgi:hypothetical protein
MLSAALVIAPRGASLGLNGSGRAMNRQNKKKIIFGHGSRAGANALARI